MAPLPDSKFIRKPEILAVLKVLAAGKYPRRDQMLVLLSAALGLRVTEAVRMRAEDFRDMREGWVYVRSAKKRRPQMVRCDPQEAARRKAQGFHNWKTKSVGYSTERRPEERLPIPPDLVQKVVAYLGRVKKGWLFPGVKGPMSERQAFGIFADACKKAGIGHKSFHALRHYRGFTVQAAKGDLDWTRRMLRHTDTKVTQMYTERTPDEERKLAKEVGW